MRAQKRDLTEPEICEALTEAGCKVMKLSRFDLLVFRGNRLYMLDCKSPGGKPTDSQEKLITEGWPLKFVRTPEEALEAVGL